MKKYSIRLFFTIVFCLCLSIPVLQAEDKPIKLNVASWNVPNDPNTKVLEAISADLRESTGGTVTTEISFKTLGKAEDYYDGVVMGMCDMAYVGLPYTPGRFPMSEMLGLPILFPDNNTAAKAHYELLKKGYLDKQFKDVKVIAVGTTSPYNFIWGKQSVPTLADFKGKKIRCPGGPWTKFTEILGGVPVSVSAAESYMAVDKGIIDGLLQSWPAVPVFKINEVCKYVTQLNLTAFTFAIVVNPNTFNKLPQAAKDVLTHNVEKYSLHMGKAHDGFNQVGMKLMADAGAKVESLSPEDTAVMKKMFKPMFDEWVKEMDGKGLPGKKAMDDIYIALEAMGVKEPFVK